MKYIVQGPTIMTRKRMRTAAAEPTSHPSAEYRCLWCLAPCEALYRNLGVGHDKSSHPCSVDDENGGGRAGGDNLQLAACRQCKETVDPYCERELLLVAMDAVLLRPEAYRHALLNRMQLSNELKGTSTTTTTSWLADAGGVTAMAASSVLRALSLPTTASAPDNPTAFFLSLGMSLLKQVVLYGVVWTFCRWRFHKQEKEDEVVPSDRLALALGLPELMWSALTLLVQVWEDTDTVRVMGSLLCATCQAMSLLALLDDASAQRTRRQNGTLSSWGPDENCWVAAIAILGLSLLIRAVIVELVAWCMPTFYNAATKSCPGFQLSQIIHLTAFQDNKNLHRLLEICWS
jgi:Arv1-like family